MRNLRVTSVICFLALAASAHLCFADDGKNADPQLAALQRRFEQRYPQIHSLKGKGIVGETYQGYLAFVKDKDESSSALVNEENADRKQLYELIAKKENTTPEKVAERNAKRNFEKARPGEFVQSADGKWQKKSS